MDIGISIGFKDAGGGDTVPFTYDTNTLWWDFTFSGNTKETTGSDTFAFVPERIVGTHNLTQNTKDYQMLVSTDGGEFNKDTVRQMYIDDVTGLTNATTGWYVALNCTIETADSHILNIARNASSTPSRGQIYVTGSRNFGVKMDDNDGGNPAWVGYSSALTLSQWYTLEMQVDISSGTADLTIWIDGVEATLAYDANPTHVSPFPSTDPSEIIVGNYSTSDNASFDGEMQQMVFQNGVPTSDIRQSISDYLVGIKP